MPQDGTRDHSPELGDASSVLLLAPPLDTRDEETCLDLLTSVDTERSNVLCVTFGSPDDTVDSWRRREGVELPSRTTIVSVGEGSRSAVPDRTAAGQFDDQVVLEFVSDPGDLTGLGMRLTECLDRWSESETRNVACFHSLTALLQYADLERAYRFLHVLVGHFEASGTVAHFHMDPGAHDVQTVNTVKTLIDAVIEVDDDGLTVTTR